MDKGEESAESPQDNLPKALDSGDIVLFNRRCMSMQPLGAAVCGVAKLFSNSKWDHVGVVVKHPDTGELLFLEADFGGVKLRSLKERVKRSKSNEIAVRRLSTVRNETMRSELYAFAQEMLGTPYEMGTTQLISSVIDPMAKQQRERLHALLLSKRAQISAIDHELNTAALTAFQRRSLQSERKRVEVNMKVIQNTLLDELKDRDADPFESKDDLSQVFCSELVAAAYQRMGLLESYPPAAGYSPKDFSSEQTNPPGVHLLRRARLSDEKYVKSPRTLTNRWRGLVGSDGLDGSIPQHQGVSEGDHPTGDARNFIKDSLKRSPLYTMIPDQYKRSHFVSSFRAHIVEPGDILFEQGAYGDSFFIVEDGLLERFMSKDNMDPLLISTLGPRNSFGTTSFIFNCPRTTTVRAKKKTLLWTVDRATFELFVDSSSDVKTLLSGVDQRRLRGILSEHFLFKRLDRLGAEELSAFFVVKFRAGEQVFKQGDVGDNFYIIKSGEFERHIRHPRPSRLGGQKRSDGVSSASGEQGAFGSGWADEEFSTLAKTLGPGQSFGELSLMYNAPRAATIRARTDGEVWAIGGESFHRLHLGGGAQYLRTMFHKYASEIRDGQPYMTVKDLLRIAKADLFPEGDRARLSSLLVSLVASNRERSTGKRRKRSALADINEVEKEGDHDQGIFIDFWEFVRFDITLNQPSAELDFAFLLADRNNSGFIDLEELQSLLYDYADEDHVAKEMLTGDSKTLQKVFGRDGSRVLSGKEFRALSKDILPPLFISDVKCLSDHILHRVEVTSEQDNFDVILQAAVPDSTGTFQRSRRIVSSFSNSMLSVFPFLKGIEPAQLFAVAVSSAAARSAVAPFERLKILMQTQSFQSPRYKGLFSGLRKMVREDRGIAQALFRGNGTNMIRIIPQAAVQLAALEQLRTHALPMLKGQADSKARASSSALDYVLVAGCAGMIAAAATYPLDYVRGRLTVQRPGFEPYRGIADGLKQSIQQAGVSSVFRGVSPTLLGVFPYYGLSFMVYEVLRPVLPKRNDSSGKPTDGSAIACSAVANSIGQLASYPFDTCRRKMQVAGFGNGGFGVRSEYSSTFQTMRNLVQAEGLKGLFRGAIPNLMKVYPSCIVTYIVCEHSRTFYRNFEDVASRADRDMR